MDGWIEEEGREGGREGGGDPLARSASEGRMNFVTPRTELRRPSVYQGRVQGRDKAQKEQQDWRARGEGVMSPLHARTALARGPACGWRDSPYNCQACLTATVRCALLKGWQKIAPSFLSRLGILQTQAARIPRTVSGIARTEFGHPLHY